MRNYAKHEYFLSRTTDRSDSRQQEIIRGAETGVWAGLSLPASTLESTFHSRKTNLCCLLSLRYAPRLRSAELARLRVFLF